MPLFSLRRDGLTSPAWLVLALLAAAGAGWLGRRAWRRRRLARFLARPLPAFARDILARRAPLLARLPAELKPRLEGHVQCFLAEKTFVGCGGLVVDDEMRLTIAAHASLLVLHRDPPVWRSFSTVLVYPESFVAPEVEYDGPVEIHRRHVRAGESWPRGPVVLSWADVLEGAADPGDGYNVVLHEFAHKLDEEYAEQPDKPLLDPAGRARWLRVLSREFERFRRRLEEGQEDFIDEYAALSPAEFFAILTELFFERGAELRRRLPELYEQLAAFYRLDPASWETLPSGKPRSASAVRCTETLQTPANWPRRCRRRE